MALMLLDTYGLVYRAFFALPGLTTSKGMPINAVYGFTMMLNKLIADEKPTHILAAFDKGMPTHRVALYAEYKAQRRVMPDELRVHRAAHAPSAARLALTVSGHFRQQAQKRYSEPLLEVLGRLDGVVTHSLIRDGGVMESLPSLRKL